MNLFFFGFFLINCHNIKVQSNCSEMKLDMNKVA